MTLSKIITVLDADFWMAREAFGTLFYNQLEMAHLILLNKIDLLDAGQTAQFLNEIHNTVPDCQVVPTIHCAIDPQTLWAEVNPKTAAIKTNPILSTGCCIPGAPIRSNPGPASGRCIELCILCL